MELHREMIALGNLTVELSVRKNNGVEDQCWVHCIGRNHEGRIIWQTPLTNEEGIVRSFVNVEDALESGRTTFSCPNEDYEFRGIADTELDKTLYYLSLF
jgi:hypothetical protein